MNSDRTKIVELNGRKFQINKMDARTSWKVKIILGAKILPFLNSFTGAKAAENSPDAAVLGGMQLGIPLDEVAKAMELIGEADIDKLIDYGLRHCAEMLHAGPTQVLLLNGTYGVADVEHDDLLTLCLVVEAIKLSMAGFFDESRWTSMFQGIGDLFQRFVPMSNQSSLPPS